MKDQPSLPTAPDPYAVASAQTASNEETAKLQQKLNLINQSTPLGNVTYSQGVEGDPDRWQSNVSLTPTGQESFDLQQNVANALNRLALSGTSQVSGALGAPLSTAGLPTVKGTLGLPAYDASSLPGAPKTLDLSKLGAMPQFDSAALNKATDAAYALQTSKLDPQYEQDRVKLEDRLINSGLSKGTPLYDQEVGNWERSRADAYQNARNTSIGQGLQYGTQLFGTQLAGRQQGVGEEQAVNASQSQNYQQMLASLLAQRGQQAQEAQVENAQALGARQQGIQEAAYLRSLPLNEVGALLGTGQVQMPNFTPPPATSISPTDLTGAVYGSANLAQKNYQAQLAQNAASMGGLFDLGGALGAAGISKWG